MRLIATTLAALLLLCVPASAPASESGPSAYAAQADLLTQRVREIAAQTPEGKFPLGAGSDFQLRFVGGRDWNSGFLASALWRSSDLLSTSAASDRALAATLDHLGFESTKLHDLGFMYEGSSVAAYQRRCPELSLDEATCRALRRSGLKAAATLASLATTTGQKIIPMSSRDCSDCRTGSTETIVDSMMNLPLLYWASRESGQQKYRKLALRHAKWVAKHLQRGDGSTYQAGKYPRRATRARVLRHTHQGKSNSGVWARGQAWSVYGFADAGLEFKSRELLAVAERNGKYIERHLPTGGVPPWDYRAGRSAPRDVSAGVITAAGLFHLSGACRAVKRGCKQAARWAPLARRILTASLAGVRTTAPVGYLGGQVYHLRNSATWDDDTELMFGLSYALEAIRLARTN